MTLTGPVAVLEVAFAIEGNAIALPHRQPQPCRLAVSHKEHRHAL
jgi:hypothetical protein